MKTLFDLKSFVVCKNQGWCNCVSSQNGKRIRKATAFNKFHEP